MIFGTMSDRLQLPKRSWADFKSKLELRHSSSLAELREKEMLRLRDWKRLA